MSLTKSIPISCHWLRTERKFIKILPKMYKYPLLFLLGWVIVY